MEEDILDEGAEELKEQLKQIRSMVGPEQADALFATINRLRDAVANSAEGVAKKSPEQFQRFLDGIDALADSLESQLSFEGREVGRTITLLRRAAAEIGFNKFVNQRTGMQENPDD